MNNKAKRKRKEKIMIITSISLIIISIFSVAIIIFLNWKPFDNQEGDLYKPSNNSETSKTDKKIDEKQLNILIAGVDESETLTDVIMVLSVDMVKNTAEVLQIPRDTFVSNTISTGKINGIYTHGDENLQPIQRLIKIIDEQFALPIDYYGVITLEAFRNIVDAVGGIPIDMPNKLVYDPSKIIPKGQQILNGEQAEWLVRHRSSYVEGDIGRIKIQRLFLASALQQVKELGLKKVTTKVIPKVYDEISSNMAVKDMLKLSDLIFDIDMENIRIHILPGEGTMHNEQSIWAIHVDEAAELLNEYFRPYSDDVSVIDLSMIRIINTGNWYEDTDDKFDDIINGVTPGEKNRTTTTTTTS